MKWPGWPYDNLKQVQRLFQLFMSTSEEPDCIPNLNWLAHIDEPREVANNHLMNMNTEISEKTKR